MGIGTAKEGIDYELIPATDNENDQSWDIRILKGEFTESVLRFGNIAFDGENDCLALYSKLYDYNNITVDTNIAKRIWNYLICSKI